MLGSEFAAGFETAAQTSGYAWAVKRQGVAALNASGSIEDMRLGSLPPMATMLSPLLRRRICFGHINWRVWVPRRNLQNYRLILLLNQSMYRAFVVGHVRGHYIESFYARP